MSDGYTMLITWPEMREGAHRQETLYAHLLGQADVVRAVQEASGALNDAKIEILGPLTHDDLVALGATEGAVAPSVSA